MLLHVDIVGICEVQSILLPGSGSSPHIVDTSNYPIEIISQVNGCV